VLCGTVLGEADDLGVDLREVGQGVAKATGFLGATGRVVLRIELEHDLLATQRFQLDSLVAGRGAFEVLNNTIEYRCGHGCPP